ncbi:TetR/AcrR family transcriptional regulator [Geomonas sp. Red32]|uniref:TetR/AcrR family transcriptional regulator n=1 Tax=Geomonas sp. Red32 TaxID=2912856 RepID=UPI00202CF45D|nr:TetR/AcrR family transcriptional regulator [Geomonas sp. Red32]MCM0082916.1 TetR/AcrR family transcriptional regulator [Geomonas sp. Red32]
MDCSEKRAAIIRATVQLVSENGFHGAPMAMVAERAGVAAGTIYRYFENKDALIGATYSELDDRLRARALDGYPEQGTPREKFFHLARVLVDWWTSSPMEFRFVEQFHNSPYGVAFRKEMLLGKQSNLCRDIFSEAQEHKAVRDLPTPVLIALALGPLIYISRDHNLGFIALDDDMLEQAIDGCWKAVAI